MKKVFALAAIMLFQMVSAQDVSKNLGDFTTVRAFDQIDVLMVKGTENKIVIKGQGKDDVEVVNKNNELKIRMKTTKFLKGDDVSVTLYYKGNIDQVEASEGARVASQDVFKATAFILNAKEGAEIKLNLEVKKLNSKASSGGILNINGTAKTHDLVITSGGIFKGKELVTEQTTVSINAGGEADVYASELVDAKTRIGGDIRVYGNPQQINENTFGGGNIKKA
ncbi:head GIN domain-containing protein [Flavobacterium sp. AG291]|uniref:head GIN domain-containing protein n=1 Tax=Flavobacterium sp. AG291 TaxID=2184000 RepID=UPI000E0CA25C|nr:head GIN domain-containing protein [Flavobacterium sp. AG291]RDI07989.1 putative autotransporter adhesin-like protein [Flavobacterium sp. AG291]